MFRKRRIQAALGQAAAMPPPSISMSRPLRSRDPGPSIPDAPGRCPLHQGQLGWNMLLPCEACIALAFVPADLSANSVVVKNDKNYTSIIFVKNDTSIIFDNSYAAVDVKNDKNDTSIIFGKNDTSIIFDNSYAASGLASSATPDVPLQCSGGVPPPPPPIACFRHRTQQKLKHAKK